MNKIILAVAALVGLSNVCSSQMTVPTTWNGFSLPASVSMDPKGGRGIVNGQWLAGYGVDVLYYQAPFAFPKLYLAINHYYNAAELLRQPGNAAGIFGPGIGMSVGGFATKTAQVYHAITPDSAPSIGVPPWLMSDLDNWLTFEISGGYRLFGHAPDVKPWECTLGGKVAVKFDVTAHH